MSTLRGGELPQPARVPAWLITLSIVSFTVAPRLGELFFEARQPWASMTLLDEIAKLR